jgi:hypothetical protein
MAPCTATSKYNIAAIEIYASSPLIRHPYAAAISERIWQSASAKKKVPSFFWSGG